MPHAIANQHTYTCNLCGWKKFGDVRTMNHAVKLHCSLVHGIKPEPVTLTNKLMISKSEQNHNKVNHLPTYTQIGKVV